VLKILVSIEQVAREGDDAQLKVSMEGVDEATASLVEHMFGQLLREVVARCIEDCKNYKPH
jgi:hypothetical protein